MNPINPPMTRGQRRVWLALEAQKRRRARAAALSSSALPAPAIVLTTDGHGYLSWTTNFITARAFNIYESVTKTIVAGNASITNPGDRFVDHSGTMPTWLCVVQCDGNGNDIPPYSNWVYTDGDMNAVWNPIILTSDGHGRLVWSLEVAPVGADLNIYRSDDGVTWNGAPFDGWNFADGGRDCSGSAGYFRVCFADANNHDVLPYSNLVYSDGL
jgi:hypothetical protein